MQKERNESSTSLTTAIQYKCNGREKEGKGRDQRYIISGSLHTSLKNRFNDGCRFQWWIDFSGPKERIFRRAELDCPRGEVADRGANTAAAAGGESLCRLGLTTRRMIIPTTIIRSRRMILRFVVRRW